MRRAGSLIVAIPLFLVLGWLLTNATDFRTTDFFCYWSGARFVVEGRDPYREELWRPATTGARPMAPFCTGAYPGPLYTAVLMAPLGALPFDLAAVLWMALSLAAALAGMVLVQRASGEGRRDDLLLYALVLFSQPFWVLLVGGQFAGLLLLATGVLAGSLARGGEAEGGVALASFAIKPQVVALFAPPLLVWALLERRRAFVVGAVATGLGLLAVSLAARPAWPLEWLATQTPRLAILPYLATAWGLAAEALGDPRWGLALVALLVAAVVALVRGARVGALDLAALTLPLSLFASPHTWSYDFLLLALPWSRTLALGSGALRLALVACASPLPWLLYGVGLARGQETWSAVVPAASALLLALAIRSRA